MDWKSKLTSRKFWVAVVGFVTGLMIYLGKTESDAQQIAALIMSGASVIAYIIGEGMIDAAGAGKTDVNVWEGMDDEVNHPPEEKDE